MKEIYLAGGCFWGVEKYLSLLPGVLHTEVGYANGHTKNPSYEEVCTRNTGHAEAVKVSFDPSVLDLSHLLERFYEVIDPTTVNRQGNDVGTQYRTGIYYVDAEDEKTIARSIADLQKHLRKSVLIEVLPLMNYAAAEAYHQKYLDKNPGGYCHIPLEKFTQAQYAPGLSTRYQPQTREALRAALTTIQFDVTQNSGTEPPFQNEYHNCFRPGIYVDITTGEPLFLSTDKFDAGCGWPSFSKPISPRLIHERTDASHGMTRTEVRSKQGDAHLGHVFPDGPTEHGGLRYCINSASLRFVPKERMVTEGYGDLLHLIQ